VSKKVVASCDITHELLIFESEKLLNASALQLNGAFHDQKFQCFNNRCPFIAMAIQLCCHIKQKITVKTKL
jgi:hypothetical protein